METKFKLTHSESKKIVKESFYLLDVFDHIRLNINDARKYHIQEFNGEDLNVVCSAYYLLENFTRLNLPLTLKEII